MKKTVRRHTSLNWNCWRTCLRRSQAITSSWRTANSRWPLGTTPQALSVLVSLYWIWCPRILFSICSNWPNFMSAYYSITFSSRTAVNIWTSKSRTRRIWHASILENLSRTLPVKQFRWTWRNFSSRNTVRARKKSHSSDQTTRFCNQAWWNFPRWPLKARRRMISAQLNSNQRWATQASISSKKSKRHHPSRWRRPILDEL